MSTYIEDFEVIFAVLVLILPQTGDISSKTVRQGALKSKIQALILIVRRCYVKNKKIYKEVCYIPRFYIINDQCGVHDLCSTMA